MAGVGTRRQIKVVSIGGGKDGRGFNQTDETLLFTGWAEVSNPTGYRDWQNGQPQIGNTKQFRVRNNRQLELDSKTRIIYDGKRYTVDSIIREKEKSFYWIIRATAEDGGRN